MTTTIRTTGNYDLARDATLRLRAGDGLAIRALRGTVLVTREGDAEDHVLEPGQTLTVAGRGLVVAWALTPAALELSRPAKRAAPAAAHAHAA